LVGNGGRIRDVIDSMEVRDELFTGKRPHGALKDYMMQVFGVHVTSGAACGETAVVPGLVGGEVALTSSEMMCATSFELV
jgi:hypothetical protein